MFQFLKGSQPLQSIVILSLLSFAWEVDCRLKSQIKMLVSSDTLHPKHFMPGVGVEILPDPIYYNKYIPLVLQYKIPDWSSDSLKLNSSYHCTSDDIKQNYNCPVSYHFERLLGPLAESMRFAKNIYSPIAGDPYFGEFSCDYIEPHFHHISTSLPEMQLYYDKLKKNCFLAKNLTVITKNLTSLTARHVSMANNKFTSLLDTNKDEANNEYKLVHMAAYMALQDAYILTKYIDTIRWSNAFTSCQSYKLNLGLVNSFMLDQSLGPIAKIAEKSGYKLSIPSHEHLPHYYKLPIADCILSIRNTKTGNLVIRVLVPVMKKELKYTKIRLSKIPYLITEGGQKKICEIDSFQSVDEFLIYETPKGANQTVTIAPDCYESELCYVPEQPRRLVVDPCIRGLMNGSLDEIREHCSFECYAVENEELIFPIIIKLSTNHFSITGSPIPGPDTKIVIFCDGTFYDVLTPNGSNGVMQVILPCNCEIHYKSQIYRPTKPCDVSLEIHYLTTTPLKMLLTQQQINEELYGENSTNLNGTEGTEALDQLIPADWVVPTEVIMEDSTCSSHGVQLAFIWIFIISLIVTNAMLLYVACYNRLIHSDMVKDLFSRWGFGNTSLRSRLEEDIPQTQPDSGQWPAGLNRL